MILKETKTYKKLKNKKKDNFPKWLIEHHVGGTDKYPLMDTSHHTAQIVEGWHLSLGWDGIGYHFYIDRDGIVWKGRPEHYHGAHTRGYNKESIGICLAGNFDAKKPTKAQVKALKELLTYLKVKYKIPNDKIVPHRKFANKTCYGKLLSNTWASDLVKKVSIDIVPCDIKKFSTSDLFREILLRLKIKL